MAGGMKAVIWADTINGVLLARIFIFENLRYLKYEKKIWQLLKHLTIFIDIFAQNDVFYNLPKNILNSHACGWSLWRPKPVKSIFF